MSGGARVLLVAAAVLVLSGCHRDMRDQPRYEVLEASPFFANGQASRPVPKGTVARGHLAENEPWETGRQEGEFVDRIPIALDRELVVRGQERFNSYCSPCHSQTGDGDGMIVRRGFRRPPSLHTDRLRTAPAGHFFDVLTRGIGAMPAYGHQIQPHDRWVIVAYIRALQLSQQGSLDDVPEAERKTLEEASL
jgi:mono/diheme cytochrome c family protein